MARSTEPCGGWKRYASAPPNSSSSVFAYLLEVSRVGVRASGIEAANGPSSRDEGGQCVSRERGWGRGMWAVRAHKRDVLCPSLCRDRPSSSRRLAYA
eukprot:6936682-Prymnesium_polylepis.1